MAPGPLMFPGMTMASEGELSKLQKTGYITTTHSSSCWSCGQDRHERKPGAQTDTWVCRPCEVTWETQPVKARTWNVETATWVD